jgi:hypothetical protein
LFNGAEFPAQVLKLQRRYRQHESNPFGLAQGWLTRTIFSKVTRMAARKYFERESTSIAVLGRRELERRIRNFRGRFKLDFTQDYLNKLSVDRLRHILLAASMNSRGHN